MKKLIYQSKGFTLLESVMIVILGSLFFVCVSQAFIQYLKEANRQQRFIQTERDLFNVKDAVAEALLSLPGRGLATTTGLATGTPILPAAGFIQDPSGKLKPIKLGIVTPYKINGQDAFTVAYADANIPRLAISQPTTASGNIGKAKVSLIALQSNFMVTKDTKTASFSSSDNPKSSSTNSTASASSNTVAAPSNTVALQVKGGGSTPTPSPSPSPSPSPTPTGTSTTGNGSSTPAIPPNVPLETTLLELPWKPSANMFKPGDVLLLINTPSNTEQNQQVVTSSRLVKIINIVGTNNSKGELQSLDITFDLCMNGECGNESGLTNTPDANTTFSAGAILVPLKIATFFYKSDKMSNRLVRNRGGKVIANENGGFRVEGGEETILGEINSFKVTYRLRDGSTRPTPNNPIVDWLAEVVSVDVEMFREIPSPYKNDINSRQARLNFPIAIRNLD
ncbi:MAG: hypothetical protein HY819_19385 [Acidobacteria bacterium]|nr:hypothetical protein [Acidobacteriota bacterium]